MTYDINDPKIDAAIDKWNSLTATQKKEFGDLMTTNESNLEVWNKPFAYLSASKMEAVVNNILKWTPPGIMIG